MTPGDRTAAQAAVQSGRETYARLDQIRGPEDAAAGIVDLWNTAETAMRAMLGGSSLSGQTLVRELRQRNLLTLEQANALASFWDARSRVDDVKYHPTLTDVGCARMGYNQLSDAVSRDTPVIEPAKSQAGDNSKPVSLEMPMYESREWPVTTKRRISLGWIIGGVAALLVLGAGGYFLFGRGSSYDRDMADAVAMMQSGRPESARGVFTRVAMEHPDQAEPHVFLSRIARNEGDLNTARRELETAIRNEPANPLPLREMGLLLLATDQAELARRFLVRAVQAAPADMAAQGYLGCALVRLNRVDEGQRFLMRAGPGAWSSCAQPVNRPAGS